MRTSTDRPSRWRRGLGAGLAGLVLTVGGVALVAPAASAQTDSGGQTQTQDQNDGPRQRPQLTDAQRQCLDDAGVEKPADGEEPTDEQREAFKAAAEECGIELPAHRGPQLTDAQRQCLDDAGVEKPAKGEEPTEAQREAFETAAEQCGIDLPQRPADQGSQNQGS